MTICVAVRTDTAVVYASDSKLTTRWIAGQSADGTPNWVDQTYDTATKVVHDRNKRLIAMGAGAANIGRRNVSDFVANEDFPACSSEADEDAAIEALLSRMVDAKRAFFTTVAAMIPPADWPGPTIMMSIPSVNGSPRTWHVEMSGERYTSREILTAPHVLLEGSPRDVLSLLYGARVDVLVALGRVLGVDEQSVKDALGNVEVLRPVDKLNLFSMPLQDAIDLAVFLARVQIEMDRFLPGQSACGGPIDVMAIRMVPTPEILSFLGRLSTIPRSAVSYSYASSRRNLAHAASGCWCEARAARTRCDPNRAAALG